jgi:hypothetical protein
MSVLLFIVGALAVVLGVGMVAYGVPVQEFSFGNTLIVAGTTLATGGLIMIAIGIAVRELRRIGEALASRTPAGRPVEMFEPRTTPSGVPFAPRSGSPGTTSPSSAPMPSAPSDEPAAAPMLRNPESPEPHEIKEYEEISLSPPEPVPAPVTQPEPSPPVHEPKIAKKRPEPLPEPPWRASPPPERQPEWPPTSFEAMWPAPSRGPVEESKPEPDREMAQAAPAETQPQRDPEVAILKSGVVDGMGYTLYVDGSIEAELPQGTLRFASINELREHLAKHS